MRARKEEAPALPGGQYPGGARKPKRRALKPADVPGQVPVDSLGIFIPTRQGDRISLPAKAGVCSSFSCRGQTCPHNARDCPSGLHPFNGKFIVQRLGMASLVTIAEEFLRTGKGRFSKKHFGGVILDKKFDKLFTDTDEASSA